MSVQNEKYAGHWLPASPSQPVEPVASPTRGSATDCWLVEFRTGSNSLPYLADHGFHDMVVLPGSFHIELVRQIHRDFFHREALSLRRIEFEKPVILTDGDVAITVRFEKQENGRVAYELFEAPSEVVRQSPAMPPCARLQVDFDLSSSAGKEPAHFTPNEWLGGSSAVTNGATFYQELRRNGNQYGPGFQVLADIRRSETQAVGHFADAAPDVTNCEGFLPPPLLDAAAQLLSAFKLENGRTFIFKSIEHMLVFAPTGSKPAWAQASVTDALNSDREKMEGAVQVFDASGTRLLELSGVTLAFIDSPASMESSAENIRLCIASTFTAEPVEESLSFWGAHFGMKMLVSFAPYNQVFQQLLDPAGAFRRNRDGINLIILGLEDWLHQDRRALRLSDPSAFAGFAESQRCVLPNGLEIVHLNRYETDYVYQEIFADESYLRHDIRLADGDTVIDIGANIGLFSLFVMSRCKDAAIYAFEPSTRVFELLQANCAAYGDPAKVRAFNCGVGEKKGRARFTFYQNSSVFSSFHPDKREDHAAVEAVVRNVLQHELAGTGRVDDTDVLELTAERLRAETSECPVTSVSDIISENGIKRIHLLKIDAEKSEMEIIHGIEEQHWPLIDQIVMEVHDRTRSVVQSIEELLTRRGFRCAVVEEKLLADSGLFNIYASRRASAASRASADAVEGLQQKVGEFCTALDTFATSNSAPLILAIAPRSPDVIHGDELDAAEDRVIACAARHAQIVPVSSKSILGRYPVRDLHDSQSNQLGHMPYTPDGYAAIGTALFRAVFNIGAPPVKVIVLDCDNTLWQGLCTEDGADGIRITPPFRRLQEFMIAQMQAGVLLALCSKNQESDVLAVFEKRTDMPLRREHLAGWRINWQPKPENLRALAAQFNLGLDGFAFLDDNPVECAAVRAGCPEVLVLQLPQQSERIPAFLDSIWIFDRASATREDRERSQWYRADSEREELRTAAPSLRDFLDGLQLRIETTDAADDHLARVAQLTMRTNQFNLTSIRRSETEIRELLKSGAKCLVTSASDRFGEYGLVGVILYTATADRFAVDTLLLSCRALGKGVEHRMVAELATRALREGKAFIELPYRRTDRNEPAREFVARLASAPNDSDFVLQLPAEKLAALRYEPENQTTNGEKFATTQNAAGSRRGFSRANLSAAMQQLGDEFNTVESVVAAMETSRLRAQQATDRSGPEFTDDASALERSLAAIWKKALGRSRIGFTENFFDAGGTSLKAVVVVAMIRRELKLNVSIITLFECPTIRLLAAKLDGSVTSGEETSAASAGAESRGRQRRNKLVKRRVA